MISNVGLDELWCWEAVRKLSSIRSILTKPLLPYDELVLVNTLLYKSQS